MADALHRKKQDTQQHLCVICTEPTSEGMPVCKLCQSVKVVPEHLYNKLSSDAAQTPGTIWKPRAKKKKRKKKRKQVAEEQKDPNENLKIEHERNQHINVPQAERMVGEPIKVDVGVITGESFGEGWWKCNPKTMKSQYEDIASSETASSEVKDATRLKYKDFYSDSEDEMEDMFGKEKDIYNKISAPVSNSASASSTGASLEEAEKVHFGGLLGSKSAHTIVKDKTGLEYKTFYSDSEDKIEDMSNKVKGVVKTSSSIEAITESASAARVSVEEGLSGLKLEKIEPKKSKEEMKETPSDTSNWGKCSHCSKEGFLLNCSRCKLSSYCGRQCQKSHYPQHKEICRRKDKFNLVENKIPEALKLPFIKKRGGFIISQFLNDLPSEFEYSCGARGVIMAEIVGPYWHLFRHGVVIRDLIGDETHILFYNKSDIYTDQTSGKTVSHPLAICLSPGNFILLLDTHFHPFIDGTVGIRIDSLSQVHFIF